MGKTTSDSWNSFLCSRLTSIETDVRTARTVRLAVIGAVLTFVGALNYFYKTPLIVAIAILGIAMAWYFLFTMAFFQGDLAIKMYNELILYNMRGKLSEDDIYRKYKKIEELEKKWEILFLHGRFWRIIIKES